MTMSKWIATVMWMGGTMALLAATRAGAADWSSRSEVGFVAARGNTTTETANAKFQIERESQKWKNTLAAGGLYGRASEVESAQRWDARYQVDHFIRSNTFWFVSGRYEEDRYSGFDYQGTASAGLGRKFFDTEITKLMAQVGLGYRSLRPEELVRDESDVVIDRIPGERSEDMVVNAAVTFEHSFNENTRVLNSLLVESGEANTATRNDLALQVKMTEVLALSLGLSVRNNSEPLPGLKNTDTLTTVNLVYVRAP
jgi:putative salt-induced outer membrane protein